MFARCPVSRWVRDDDVSFCQVCDTAFGLFNRKHHCRCCGRCICGSCGVKKGYADGAVENTCKQCVVNQKNGMAASSPPPGSPIGNANQQPQYQQQQQYPPPQQQQQQQQSYYYNNSGNNGYPPPPMQPQSGAYPPPPPPGGAYPPQQQYNSQPKQQQQQYPPPPQQQQQQQPQPGYPMAVPIGGVQQYPTSDACDEAMLQQICAEFEMKPQYLPSLHAILNYDVALVCDDSGSMSLQADDDNPNLTRWAELKQAVGIILRVTAAMGKTVDVYFINRGVFRGVQTWNDIAPQFIRPPGGLTNTVRILQQLWADRANAGILQRPFVCHLFTDGHPTNNQGNEDINGFAMWMRNRQCIANTYFAILLCTDAEEVCNMYRPLEYRVSGRFGWTGPTCGIQGVDVTEDYRGERRDILQLRGQRYSFTFGDYIAKCLVGVIDPVVHMIDLPQGASMYRTVTYGNNNNGGCANQ